MKSVANLSVDDDHGRHRSDQFRAWPVASRSVGVVARQPGLGPRQRGGGRSQECRHLLHARAAASALCTQTGTTLCGYPSDQWGWAVVSGTEIKLDFAEPGQPHRRSTSPTARRIAVSRRNSLTSPGLFGSGNQVAFGVLTDAVYVNGSSLELTTAWTAGGGFEYFWTRNFSSTIYGSYTEVSYNNTVVTSRWFCGGAAGAQSAGLLRRSACDPGFRFWKVGTHHDWFPVPGLRLAVDVLYTGVEIGIRRPDHHAWQGGGRSSDRRLHRQGPGHSRGRVPRSAHLGRRLGLDQQTARDIRTSVAGHRCTRDAPRCRHLNPGRSAGVFYVCRGNPAERHDRSRALRGAPNENRSNIGCARPHRRLRPASTTFLAARNAGRRRLFGGRQSSRPRHTRPRAARTPRVA